ncbi:hypothetical protein C2I27_22880 [Priestia megaterium]|nr:hypothetical protein C2I27_22880 [Priestia megaterium]
MDEFLLKEIHLQPNLHYLPSFSFMLALAFRYKINAHTKNIKKGIEQNRTLNSSLSESKEASTTEMMDDTSKIDDKKRRNDLDSTFILA